MTNTLTILPELAMELMEKGHRLIWRKLTPNEHTKLDLEKYEQRYPYGFEIENFGYKEAGCIIFSCCNKDDCNELAVTGRYKRLGTVSCYNDIVRLNFRIWLAYKDRYEGWAIPDDKWSEDMVNMGLVARQEKISVTYNVIKGS